MKQQQWKRLEVADQVTFELLLEMRAGAERAMAVLDRRLGVIRNRDMRSADADQALTETKSILRKYMQDLDQLLAAKVERTGPDGGPVVWFQNREGMYFEGELSMD